MRNYIDDTNETDLNEDRPRFAQRPVMSVREVEEAFCAEFVKAYFDRTRPTMAQVYRGLLWKLWRENERRARAGLPLFQEPSFSAFRRRITAFPVAMKGAARYGMRRA